MSNPKSWLEIERDWDTVWGMEDHPTRMEEDINQQDTLKSLAEAPSPNGKVIRFDNE